ncbi:SSNA1_1 [Blepharisma stoltei]|uniref:Sjoegren syndrome nuclear autoantigen 1 n=1 Tax=Blepharisma stoltei TaxID=1481888 RepID=A0AAU9JPD1_9CILI|nr:unnamed protein product [Blepharisma stoltei]
MVSQAKKTDYTQNLILCIEELKTNRDCFNKQIEEISNEKLEIEKELERLNRELDKVNEGLSKKIEAKSGFDKAIEETESAYKKILETSQTLLHVLKREKMSLKSEQD